MVLCFITTSRDHRNRRDFRLLDFLFFTYPLSIIVAAKAWKFRRVRGRKFWGERLTLPKLIEFFFSHNDCLWTILLFFFIFFPFLYIYLLFCFFFFIGILGKRHPYWTLIFTGTRSTVQSLQPPVHQSRLRGVFIGVGKVCDAGLVVKESPKVP